MPIDKHHMRVYSIVHNEGVDRRRLHMRKQLSLWVRALMAVALIATLVLAGCGAPQQVNPAPAPVSAPGAESLSAPGNAPRGTPQEGIQVHGHWTIEVRNPDGTLAERREFENALLSTGAGALTKLMARQNSLGGWIIRLSAVSDSSSPFTRMGTPIMDGWLIESSFSTQTNEEYYKNLTVTRPDTGPDANKLVLNGTATAQRDGAVHTIGTSFSLLSATIPPRSDYDIMNPFTQFTSTTLVTDVNVTTGQQISVTVAISFS